MAKTRRSPAQPVSVVKPLKNKGYALSLRQPWAALLVHGCKWIEIRRWPTDFRGRLLIHAAKLLDSRFARWPELPDDVRKTTELRGGIIGSIEITGCVRYRTIDAFKADRRLHLNEPAWFQTPAMYGFVMTRPERLPFRPLLGYVKIFEVTESLG